MDIKEELSKLTTEKQELITKVAVSKERIRQFSESLGIDTDDASVIQEKIKSLDSEISESENKLNELITAYNALGNE